MDVLGEILSWSKDRPDWQRDALRRLVVNGDLQEGDFEALTRICKGAHGLEENQKGEPLAKTHIPADSKHDGVVNLVDILHHDGVNALAKDQKIAFGQRLTVVYGDNAAGKSGYTRILKSACQARGSEEILGNVLSGVAPPPPSASIRFTVGDSGTPLEWPGSGNAEESLGRVSVFDSHSAAVYLREKTDVAFRPFGLDLFDKLSDACERVQGRLERDRRALGAAASLPELPEGTAAHKLLAGLSSLTKPQTVTALGTLSGEENERLVLLEKQLADMLREDPAKASRDLKLRAGRFRSLVKHLAGVDAALAPDVLQAVFHAQKDAQVKQSAAEQLREATFSVDLLTGTGSDKWSMMWEAARDFSKDEAYKDRPFPVTEDDARCVLCQQGLGHEAAARLKQFETFVVSPATNMSRAARARFAELYKALDELKVTNELCEEITSELRIEDTPLADEIQAGLVIATQRRMAAIQAVKDKKGSPADPPDLAPMKDKVEALAQHLDKRVEQLEKGVGQGDKEKIVAELQELRARETLGKNEVLVLGEIERKAQIAAYELCLRDTRTTAITRKSTEITKQAVTKQLKRSFGDELRKFRFTHVEVELQEAGGERGALYHKLILKRAPGIEVPKVVSEGEARCLSIAAFFAELSTADDPSAILFDDPVSSLDHKWRSSVAERLVEEAKTRQVIVFTHDIVFLLSLHRFAEEQNIELHDQHLRRHKIGAGVCEERLPWAATKVKTRIGILKNDWQAANALHKAGNQRAYEREAIVIYNLLRGSWERALEEVLLDGVVERYRESVQTQQIRKIADITEQDCEQLEAGMTRCSKWLHDQAAAENEDVPQPEELKADIEALEEWVAAIRQRRE